MMDTKNMDTKINDLKSIIEQAKQDKSNLANNIKIITDDQMKNADYLNSIGFTVTPTN